MILPSVILKFAASDMNDSAQTTYTNDALLPYFNMAVEEMFQRMQESNIPITNKTTSPPITVPPNTTEISFSSTPALPVGLVDVEQTRNGISHVAPEPTVVMIAHYSVSDYNSRYRNF